jgi:parallel beta-helix repeat protein
MSKSQRISLVVVAALAAAGTLLVLTVLTGPIQAVRAAPGTLCVAPGGTGCVEPCGGCYASVQAAVSDADPGDEILVAEGVYTTNGAAQVASIDEGITVRGGYTTTNWIVPHPTTQPAVLDAEGLGRVVYVYGDITPTLEGLWLTNGQAGDSVGIYALGAHPVISGCRVFSNATILNGGGIHLEDSPGAALMNNWVYSNTAANGGGIHLDNSPGAVLMNNWVYSNTAGNGGGIYFQNSAGATVVGNEIYSNTSIHDGGGLTLGGSGSGSVLEDNDVFCNIAYEDGGGINIISSGGATLIGNRFYSNTADETGGGLVIGQSDDVLLLRNEIFSNTASSGSGLSLFDGQNARLVNTLIVGNRAVGSKGAGVRVVGASVHMLHTTLARNSGVNGVYALGGTTATVWMTNTILVSHTVGVETGGSLCSINLEATLWGAGEWANGIDVYTMSGSIATGTVNVWGDPGFVAPDGGDYHIGPGSAAIDRGVDAGVTDDIDGDSRPIGLPDLGMDEWGMRICLPIALRNYQ